MNRTQMLDTATGRGDPWDMIVIGGGATGVGVAVDAATRGYSVLLLERSDFGKGTSSRSTKLVHGGVRYLQQGNVSLVMEALKERGLLRRNAPHLVRDLRFIVPTYDWWGTPFYGVGLKIYDMLAGRYGFGPSRMLSRERTVEYLPTIRTDGLRGGVQYYDGQFDDARLLINLAQTAADHGATLVNYAPVTGLLRGADGLIDGVAFTDAETGSEHEARAGVVINATGPFADGVRRMDEPDAEPMIAPSQGVHLVFDGSFLPGDNAIMVPHTRDGRVMFAIPWHGHTLVGTTDTPVEEAALEPVPMNDEIDFILDTASGYLAKPPTRADVLSTFAGIRPLVRAGGAKRTAALSRDHTIHIAQSGLLTIAGGKWTTYRHMAEDCVDHAATIADLPERPCATRELHIHGYRENADPDDPLAFYGADAEAVRAVGDDAALHPDLALTEAQVCWAVRHEMARTVDDLLARRTRCLLLNAAASIAVAERVAELMAAELGRDEAWRATQVQTFNRIAAGYLVE